MCFPCRCRDEDGSGDTLSIPLPIIASRSAAVTEASIAGSWPSVDGQTKMAGHSPQGEPQEDSGGDSSSSSDAPTPRTGSPQVAVMAGEKLAVSSAAHPDPVVAVMPPLDNEVASPDAPLKSAPPSAASPTGTPSAGKGAAEDVPMDVSKETEQKGEPEIAAMSELSSISAKVSSKWDSEENTPNVKEEDAMERVAEKSRSESPLEGGASLVRQGPPPANLVQTTKPTAHGSSSSSEDSDASSSGSSSDTSESSGVKSSAKKANADGKAKLTSRRRSMSRSRSPVRRRRSLSRGRDRPRHLDRSRSRSMRRGNRSPRRSPYRYRSPMRKRSPYRPSFSPIRSVTWRSRMIQPRLRSPVRSRRSFSPRRRTRSRTPRRRSRTRSPRRRRSRSRHRRSRSRSRRRRSRTKSPRRRSRTRSKSPRRRRSRSPRRKRSRSRSKSPRRRRARSRSPKRRSVSLIKAKSVSKSPPGKKRVTGSVDGGSKLNRKRVADVGKETSVTPERQATSAPAKSA